MTAVLGAFAVLLHSWLERSLLESVDAELGTHARGVVGRLQVHPDGHFDLELSDEEQRYFQQVGDAAPYFVVWTSTQSVSSAPHTVPRPDRVGRRSREGRRETVVVGPAGSLFLVGRRIDREEARLHSFLRVALGLGSALVLVTMVGIWVFSHRALLPLRRMSETASRVSASNFSERIDPSRTATELGHLAQTLNETFDRLQATFERQTRFTADASHELRTPLSIVLSQIELALRKDRTAPEYREALEICRRAALRMKGVVEGLLTLARADAGDLSLAKDPIDLDRVVEETLSFLRPLAEEKRITMNADLRPAAIEGDRNRLREAISNLVTNAIRYNREGGRIDVAVVRDGDLVRLSVADTGVGIPEKDQPNLFGRFYCVDKARCRDLGGSGLGLSITKWIVEAHRGTISFTSREGEGSTFTVRLPARGVSPGCTATV